MAAAPSIGRLERRLARLTRDRTSSSTTIGLALVEALERFLAGSTPEEVAAALGRLRAALAGFDREQPALALVRSLAHAVEPAEAEGTSGRTPAELRRKLLSSVRAIRTEVVGARSAVARRAGRLLGRGRSVLTLSYSTEVREALLWAHARDRTGAILVGASGPGCEGRALVRDLRRAGLEAHELPMEALELGVQAADLALVGADSVLEDGALVSKLGTHRLAEACRRFGRPIYATASTSKFRGPGPFSPGARRARRRAPAVALGTLFDRTPARLVAGYVTERGILRPPPRPAGRGAR
jgi:translation initiation factor eIF-2B subunit delta